jgi:AraC-like DNA-binding protein
MALVDTVTFSVQYLEMIESFLQAQGQDIAPLYVQLGLSQLDPMQPGIHLNIAQFSILLSAALPFCSDKEPISIQLLRHLPLTAHGLVGMACMTADTMGQALDIVIRYSSLLQSLFDLHRLDGHQHACLTLHHHHALPESLRGLLTEIFVGSIAKMAQFAHGAIRSSHTARPDISMQVLFTHDSQLQFRRQFMAYFHGDVQFRAKADQFLIENRVLRMPIFTANRMTHASIVQQLEQQLQQQQAEQGLAQQIRVWLRREVSIARRPHAAQVASHFAMSERTLSRKLKIDQLTIHQLIEEAQLERAQWLLSTTGSSVQQVAEQVGFADSTSFARAFKRLTSQTPSEWRTLQN